jgi:HlyD family secretion protein
MAPARAHASAPRRSRRVRGAALARLLCALVLAGCSADARPLIASAPAERGRIERLVVASGTIEPEREVELRSRIAGIVQKIHVKAGDRVEQGHLLVELDQELTAVQARGAAAELDSARIERALASRELERIIQLRGQGAATQRQLDEARARRDMASAAEERVASALAQLEVQLRYSSLTAPITGKILDVQVEEGSAVAALTAVSGGTVLLTLAEEDRLHLLGLVDENEVTRIHVGQEARVVTEAFGKRTFAGRVRDIAPIGQRRQNVTYFEVEVELLDGLRELRPKMSGDAEIVTETVENAVLVPENALVYEGERTYVDTLAAEGSAQTERRAVEIGIASGGRVQIVSGVEADQRVKLR